MYKPCALSVQDGTDLLAKLANAAVAITSANVYYILNAIDALTRTAIIPRRAACPHRAVDTFTARMLLLRSSLFQTLEVTALIVTFAAATAVIGSRDNAAGDDARDLHTIILCRKPQRNRYCLGPPRLLYRFLGGGYGHSRPDKRNRPSSGPPETIRR